MSTEPRSTGLDPRVCSTTGEPPTKVRAEQVNETGQHKSYLILCDRERAKGFVKPYRNSYRHRTCGAVTTMGRSIAETYARDPYFYGATFCVTCNVHRPLAEFTWEPDGEPMDTTDPAWVAHAPPDSEEPK
jgi:hypothetical protein